MENKIKNFLVSFNGELENSNRYCNLQLFDDGFVKGITFPKIYLFDDDNDDVLYVEEKSLCRLIKTLDKVLEIAKQELSYKVDEFFAEKKKEAKEKFSEIKIKFNCENSLQYSTFVSGNYNEDMMEQFLDVVKEDFEYIFEGLKLDIDL